MASTAVQLAIGLVLVFVLVGSACSFLNELVAALLNRRAIHLQRWLVKLLGPDKDSFLEHPIVRGLRGTRLDLVHDRRDRSAGTAAMAPAGPRRMRQAAVPSYISAETFTTTLLSILGRTDTGHGAVASAGELRGAIGTVLRNEQLRALLQALLADAGDDVERFRRRVEAWYAEEMDRLSGWYKRRTKWFLLAWALGLAVALNVDALLITRTLWTDATLRNVVVAEAQRTATPSTAAGQASGEPCPIAPTGAGTPDPLDCVAARVNQIRALQLPVGWASGRADARVPHDTGGWALKLVGLAVTALAGMQGGQFWFDLLGKLVNLRLTGPPPAR